MARALEVEFEEKSRLSCVDVSLLDIFLFYICKMSLNVRQWKPASLLIRSLSSLDE